MKFSIELEGFDQVRKRFANMAPEIDKETNKALFAIAKKVEGDAKMSIQQGNKSGRIYRRRSIVHQASAPGEAPASDTGRLVNSINGKLVGKLVAVVTASTNYARFLEFGTRKIAPRPYMRPAWEGNKKFAMDRVIRGINIALRKGSK